MTRKYQSIKNKAYPAAFVLLLILAWSLVCALEIVPPYLLPSPYAVIEALATDFPLLLAHAGTTLTEALFGLSLSVAFGVLTACVMDRFDFLYLAAYPVLVLTQTIPAIAIAPLLVLWMGFGMAPKVLLIFITCFFPVAVSTLSGLRSVDQDVIDLFRGMGASPLQILARVKLKASLDSFFAGLKLAGAYSIVGAVISEWLGGAGGLGVYMTRVRKAYAFDKMFAAIILISLISLLLMRLIEIIHKKSMPWRDNAK
ncbi:MAG: ABC transporter permease [Clostridiales bacterium]|nr:ABC transporter permease [Clostridiales bacterium]